jgi:hypothetical protein
MEELPMKVLLATAALATLVNSSADAQYGNWRGDYRAYAQVPPYAAYSSYGVNRAYAQVPPPAAYGPLSPRPSTYDLYGYPLFSPVYGVRGQYVGRIRIPACAISWREILTGDRVRDHVRRTLRFCALWPIPMPRKLSLECLDLWSVACQFTPRLSAIATERSLLDISQREANKPDNTQRSMN